METVMTAGRSTVFVASRLRVVLLLKPAARAVQVGAIVKVAGVLLALPLGAPTDTHDGIVPLFGAATVNA
jgi:hypothetical protein